MADDGTAPDTGDGDTDTDTDATAADGQPGTGDTDLAAEVAKWKALARKHEGVAKKNADAASKLAELEDADKSEVERLSGRAAAAEAKAVDAEKKLLRAEIAWKHGLTPDQAKRLIGDTAEDLEADAKELLAAFGPADTGGPEQEPDPGPRRRRPVEKLRPGAAPAGTGDKPDPAAIAKKILSNPF